MSLIIQTAPINTAGTKQFSALAPTFTGFQTKDSVLTNKVYFDNSSVYPITNVATGTSTQEFTGGPLVADLYTTIYEPGTTNIPLVGQARDYTNASIVAADDGVKVGVSMDLGNENWAVAVVKSSGTSTAGKLKIRETGTQEVICSFTTSGTADTWTAQIFQFKNTAASNVTAGAGGLPDYSAITELEITGDTLGTDIQVAMVYFANNNAQIIGKEQKIVLDCISEFGVDGGLETSEIICNQLADAQTATSESLMLKIGSKNREYDNMGTALGNTVVRKSTTFSSIYNSEAIGGKTIAAGTITVVAGLTINYIKIGTRILRQVDSADQVPEGAFHYDSTTITFNTAYNGEIPEIVIWDTAAKNVLTRKALELGFVGYLEVPRKPENRGVIYWRSKKVQASLDPEGFNDDGDQINYNLKVFKDSNGNMYEEIS